MSPLRWPARQADLDHLRHEQELLHAYITAVLQAVTERAALDRELRQLAEQAMIPPERG